MSLVGRPLELGTAHATRANRILVADDDASMRLMLDLLLKTRGYEVALARNGEELVHMAQEQGADLLIVDLMMPRMDGFEAIRQLRNDTRTAHLPMLVLTALDAPSSLVTGFQAGADDYLTKPFNVEVLVARVENLLRRASRQPVLSPLTGMCGNQLILAELQRRIDSGMQFAFLYIDLDNFKAFNDTYGFARGDTVILALAAVVREAVSASGGPGDFIGHIGGDDFVVISTPASMHHICQSLIQRFDTMIGDLYDADDLARGYLTGTDRYGVLRHFPILSVSIAGVTNERRAFQTPDEVSQVCAEMKHYIKTRPGSGYAVDMRTGEGRSPTRERRAGSATVLLVCADGSLRRTIQRVLREVDLRVLEASSLIDAQSVLAHEPRPVVLIGEAVLIDGLVRLVRQIRIVGGNAPLLVVANSQEEADRALACGAALCFQQPFPIQALVDETLARLPARAEPEMI